MQDADREVLKLASPPPSLLGRIGVGEERLAPLGSG